jgi:hypothetical protein
VSARVHRASAVVVTPSFRKQKCREVVDAVVKVLLVRESGSGGDDAIAVDVARPYVGRGLAPAGRPAPLPVVRSTTLNQLATRPSSCGSISHARRLSGLRWMGSQRTVGRPPLTLPLAREQRRDPHAQSVPSIVPSAVSSSDAWVPARSRSWSMSPASAGTAADRRSRATPPSGMDIPRAGPSDTCPS